MRWWAIIPPLAAHSRGHMHSPPNHPLHGAGCGEGTLWAVLDKLYDSTRDARLDLLSNQYTVSLAFDNWQQMATKTWQSNGSSAVFLKGVAAFFKKDKAVLLPIGSIIRSPSNVRFRITSSRFLDPYLILIKGSVMDDHSIQDNAVLPSDVSLTRQSDIDRVTRGMLCWPCIGWDVLFLRGVQPSPELQYIDPIIPPPMHACVGDDVPIEAILFSKREFKLSGQGNSRYITSGEYDTLILEAEDILMMNNHVHYFKSELASQMRLVHPEGENDKEIIEETVDDGNAIVMASDNVEVAVIPHDFAKEHTFVEHFSQCSTEVYWTSRFRGDVTTHLYPHSRKEDIYVHPPLIGRNETTTEGMMLANAALLEMLALLIPVANGKYSVGNNALNRRVFMYGDALTVSLHSTLHDKILRGITRLGNESYVETLLSVHERIFMQKGQFHQQIHLLGTIYQQFYGGLMQPFVAENRVKRVNGDPIKGGFQSHDQFAKKMYRSCNRFMFRRLISSGLLDSITRVEFKSNAHRLRWMLDRYREYRMMWETSDHEPSRMVALFLKSMRCYLRCDKAINKHDVWHLEIESANLLPIWKTFGKNNYLKIQCEFMERCYDDILFPPIYREIMRANNLCVKPSGHAVAFDEQNENMNLRLKRCPKVDSLDLAIRRSRHLIVGGKAAKELWGDRKRKKITTDRIRGNTLEDDIALLEQLLVRCNIFMTHEKTKMVKEYFWEHVRPNDSPVGSRRDHDRTDLPLSNHETVMLSRLVHVESTDEGKSSNDTDDVDEDIIDEQSLHSNDDDESIVSRSSQRVAENNLEEDGGDADNPIGSRNNSLEIESTLRMLNIKNRKPLHRHATTDVFEYSRASMDKNLRKSRMSALSKIERKRDFVRQSVKYFTYQMSKKRELLERCYLRSCDPNTEYFIPSWKVRYQAYMTSSRDN
jgi:hypothetical protein